MNKVIYHDNKIPYDILWIILYHYLLEIYVILIPNGLWILYKEF
jgi:hypothetical protein